MSIEEGVRNGAFEMDSNGNEHQPIRVETIFEVPSSERNYNNSDYDVKSVTFSKKYNSQIKLIKKIAINTVIGGYFAWATVHYIKKDKSTADCENIWCNGYGMLLVLIIFVYTCIVYFKLFKPLFGNSISTSIRPYSRQISNKFQQQKYLKFITIGIVLIIFAIYIGIDAYESPERLRSLLGIVILFGAGFAFSKHRSEINWRPVVFGVILQFLMGIFCIRMKIGRQIFGCLGEKVAVFFSFGKVGAEFVYGHDLVEVMKVFAFSVLPVVFFFSFIISILYYYGAMQWIIQKMGLVLSSIIGTTVCESVTVAANIFLSMTESPLIIKPYIKYLTASEIHVIMSSGFATVSGTVLAAYMAFGADASHLITSSVMAAPATLAFSKLIYPETEISQTTSKSFQMEKSTDSSVLDAASSGAFAAINLISGIISNVIAFVAFVAFLNGIVGWLGMLVGYDYISIEFFLGKLFIPLAYIIGIPWKDCGKVGEVIALKNIVNEFVAYKKLGELKAANEISLRSSVITTFAICGFANMGSIGIMIGSLGTMCPEKRSVVTSVAVRALISGTVICFINASIAGLLITEEIFASK